MRLTTLAVLCAFVAIKRSEAQDWQATTSDLVKKEKPGFGGVCGVVVDRANGHVYINLSDRGVYRSTDRGQTWERHGKEVKGRTETPGCMYFDPTGRTNDILLPLVYGSPIAYGSKRGGDWHLMDEKSVHVDWCAVDWGDLDRKFVLTLKHESGGLLLLSRDGGKSFSEVGRGYGQAWVFDADTAVAALAKGKDRPKASIARTTDGGATFKPISDYSPVALPRWHGDALYWLVEGALVKTIDKGATWLKVCDLKDARFGPVFGKEAKQMFVLTGAGIIESADSGTNWSKPIAAPKEMKGVGGLTWVDYDQANDVLYLMKMGSELFKLERAQAK